MSTGELPPVRRPRLCSRRPTHLTDGAHRTLSPLQTEARLSRNPALWSVVLGSEAFEDPWFGIPATVVEHTVPGLDHSPECMGKGFTSSQALCSGLVEAVERHCCAPADDEPMLRAAWSSLGDTAVDPISLGVRRHGPYRPDLPIDWTSGWSLTRDAPVALPVLFGLWVSRRLGHRYLDEQAAHTRYTLSDSNGCAAGLFLEEAFLSGLLEVIERDAIMVTARSGLVPPDVDVHRGVRNAYLREILDRLHAEPTATVHLKDLTLDLAVPTFACTIVQRTDDFDLWSLGYGAHLDPDVALLRAITESFQARALRVATAGQLRGASNRSTLPRVRYLTEPSARTVSFDDLEDRSSGDLLVDLERLVEAMAGRGMEVIAVDRTRDDLGIPAVKVVVSGAQRMDWSNLFGDALLGAGSRRVWEVPVALGLHAAETDPAALLSRYTFY